MKRHLWLAGTVIGFVMLTASLSRADEADAVKVLEKAKATVIRDDKAPGQPVTIVIMWGPGFDGALLKELKECKHLLALRIGGPWITDDGVKELRAIKSLELLEIRSPKVSDAALKDLQTALPKLRVRRAAPGETPFAGFSDKK